MPKNDDDDEIAKKECDDKLKQRKTFGIQAILKIRKYLEFLIRLFIRTKTDSLPPPTTPGRGGAGGDDGVDVDACEGAETLTDSDFEPKNCEL
uniref:Uncharacterized protein n=1 Tax=Romanomermis culicivorax TaxID=13658 RepID=A0A915I8F8_ROMCU